MSEDDPTSGAGSGDQDGDVVRRDRFSGGPARDFLSSLAADERIFGADLDVDRAHVIMLAEQDIISDEDAGAILGALDDVEAAGHADLPDGEDVHAAIETAVIQQIGDVGGRMHTARSRNDEVATCIRYRLREDLLSLLETTCDVREGLVNGAEEYRDVLMPGYTHLQPAQPITVGFWMASYAQALARDTERLLDAYDRVNRSPLGGAAFAGTTFDVDRERTAQLLGFTGGINGGDPVIVENAMDATAGRDVLVEVAAACSALAVTVSGMAADGILFANRGFMEPADEYASTSSIMPQKKNPDTLELARSCAGEALGATSGLGTTLKGLPRAYNRDLQNATPHLWRAIDETGDALEVAGGAILTAEWNEDVLTSAAGEGFSTATGVADCLAREGIPFREAHEIVAAAATALPADGPDDGGPHDVDTLLGAVETAFESVTGESLKATVSTAAIQEALDPDTNVRDRDSLGGAAPDTVEAWAAREWDRLDADMSDLATLRSRRDDALRTLYEVADTYV